MKLSLISKNIRQFPILFVCGILIPLTLVFLVMRGPKALQYEAQQTDLEREWQNIQTNIERSNGLDEDIVLLESGLASIRERLMDVDEVASNYEFFYGLERASGVNMQRFSQGVTSGISSLPIGRAELRHFSAIPYDLTMTGTLDQLLGFLDLLDRQEFIIRMDLLNIAASGRDGLSSDKLNARLRCHVLASKND